MLNELISANSEQRNQLFVTHAREHNQVWILTDDDGAVMLTTDDEDCIPVWPSQEAADLWRNAEWQHCEAKPISLPDWFSRWTTGMQQDELCVALCPLPGEDGLVLSPDEFEQLLQ
ncbi:DUF2750 domain-containing protein [Alteromonas oceanisediminis]|uniref:DUF2750 domain-containing protein n=1 Tax=Alteromonas oceanisediminis TaxID=2836180 RepID=UPI001BDA5876|nr:DUF2750 domain-containing protein [Alteromonas oceanisediminis]MBT0587357.1 DUF2750 domain-containing protein [Alteromonas oceanisediminis]